MATEHCVHSISYQYERALLHNREIGNGKSESLNCLRPALENVPTLAALLYLRFAGCGIQSTVYTVLSAVRTEF